jgi:hypothetical protein
METQNVSAQLYFKQLPEDKSAASYNCQNTYPNLSTCVNNVETDTAIENAFAKQLKLSEYYKSPEVFGVMKRDFMDKTMEHENEPVQPIKSSVYPTPPPVAQKIPVGPTDFLKKYIKEGFGSTGSMFLIILLIVALIVAAWYGSKYMAKTYINLKN